MIRASAPGRAGIVGNPTDIYGGSVVSCSISERAYCQLSSSDELAISMGADTAVMTDCGGLALDGGKFDLAKAALQALGIDPAADRFAMAVRTDVPEQAGLAGSAAMLACAVGCLLAYRGRELSKPQLAEMIRRIEADVMKITCGYQDHYMAVFGGLNFMDFGGKEGLGESDDEPCATVEPLVGVANELPMVLAHTGVKRCSGSVHKGLRQRWLDGEEQVVDGYRRIAELGRLGRDALLAQDWERLGELMNENHAIQRDLGGSGGHNERLIEAALAEGALGAKLAGAGHGGTIIVLADDAERMADVLLRAGAGEILRLKPADGLTVERE